jgi:ketosteroid isomerase-like protein
MSQENVETVRQAWSGLDQGDLDAAFRDAAPDVEFDQTRALGMDRGVYTLDEFKRLTESFIKTWRSVRWEADELIDAGEHVVLAFTNRLTGRDGITLEAHGTLVWTFRAEKIIRVCLYQDRAEALEAAGLSE